MFSLNAQQKQQENELIKENVLQELAPANQEFRVPSRYFCTKGFLFRHYILMIGGERYKIEKNGFFVFDLVKQVWSQGEILKFPKNWEVTSCNLCLDDHGRIIAFGVKRAIYNPGEASEDSLLGAFTVEEFPDNKIKLKWNVIAIPTRFTRNHSLNAQGNKIYAFGGQVPYGEELRMVNDLQIFELDDSDGFGGGQRFAHWDKSEPQPSPRASHSAAIINNNLYVYGGNDGRIALGDMWALDLSTLKWNQVDNGHFLPRYDLSVQKLDKNLLLFGGSSMFAMFTRYENDLSIYNTENGTYKTITFTNGSIVNERMPVQTFEIYQDKLIIGQSLRFFSIQLAVNNKSKSSEIPVVAKTETKIEPKIEVNESEEKRVRDSLKKLYEEKSFADVTFKVEGQTILAHKGYLAARSPHFHKLFTNSNAESIEISDMKAETFKAVLEYIYCSEINLNEDLAKNLFPVSAKYSLEGIRELCERYLMKQLKVDNIVEVAQLSQDFQAKGLQEAVLKFLRDNLDTIHHRDDLRRLPVEIMYQLCKK